MGVGVGGEGESVGVGVGWWVGELGGGEGENSTVFMNGME